MRNNTRKRITTQELCRRYNQGHRDFSNIILKNKDLKDKDLTGANFSGAILTGTKFHGATLQNTNFSNAKLKGVDFSHADLTGANFSQVKASFLDWRKIIPLILFILIILLYCILINILIWEFSYYSDSTEFLLDILFYNIFFVAIPLLFVAWLYSFIPIPFRTLRRRTKFAHSDLNGADFRSAKLEEIDFSTSRNLEKINFHNASLHRANFRGKNLEKSDFSNAKLYGTNFSKTKLKQSNFTHSKSRVPFTFGIHLLSIIIFSFFGFSIALIPALSFYVLLRSQIISFTSETQDFSIFAYIFIVLVGCFYFLCSSVFKDMDEAVAGICFTALSIVLVMTNQPIIIISVLFTVLIAIIRIVQIVWKINPFCVILLLLFLLILCGLVIYNYTDLAKEEVIELIAFYLVLFPFLSIRIAVTIAELEMILGWGKWISVVIVGAVLSIPLLLFLMNNSDQWEVLVKTLIVGSILLGCYLGVKGIEDNPNYRAIRDRSVWLFHVFGRFGTQFRESDLTCADFSFASLKNADFTNANLTHAVWNGTRQLEYAKFGCHNYLRYPQIRQLFSNHFPRQSRSIRKLIRIYRHWPNSLKKLIHFCLRERTYKPKKDFKGCDLRGIRLSYYGNSGSHNSFNLSNANFEDADLRDADLRGANLRYVSFVNTQLDEADLSYSDLTNACIQDWQITRETVLKQVRCQRLELEKRISKDIEPASQTFNEETILHVRQLQTLLISDQEQEKLDELKNEFAKLNLIRNKVNRRYHLIQKAKDAEESDGIPSELYIQMFEVYRKQRIQAQRKQSWWQSIIWFKIEPRIEQVNQWTQELDIFPLFENLGRLSILFVVIAFVNNSLKINPEKRYRPWEIIHSDTKGVIRGVNRFALEQLVQERANLTDLEAKEADLKGINLRGANLSNADFSKAELNNANLIGANLSKANLSDANLSNAKLGNCFPLGIPLGILPEVIRDMQRTNLTEATLTRANLSHVDLTNANLTEANLTEANLTEATLTRADLTQVDLTKLDFTKFDLTKVKLTGAIFKGAILTNIDLTDVNLTDVDLTGATLTNANLTNADLTRANLSKVDLTTLDLTKVKLTGADLTEADLTNVDLTNMDLTGANLTNATVKGANLTKADLRGANLSKVNLTDEQIKSACKWRLAVYTNAKWDNRKKIWVPKDEDANNKKIEEIENDPAPELCSKNATE